jgi:membrane protein YdbS with pleckstrin-like domain
MRKEERLEMNNDFKRLWKLLGTIGAYVFFCVGLIAAAGAMYYIGVAYWKYILIAFVSFTIWFIAGLIVTRKDRRHRGSKFRV